MDRSRNSWDNPTKDPQLKVNMIFIGLFVFKKKKKKKNYFVINFKKKFFLKKKKKKKELEH